MIVDEEASALPIVESQLPKGPLKLDKKLPFFIEQMKRKVQEELSALELPNELFIKKV
jgi:hypothetical protein